MKVLSKSTKALTDHTFHEELNRRNVLAVVALVYNSQGITEELPFEIGEFDPECLFLLIFLFGNRDYETAGFAFTRPWHKLTLILSCQYGTMKTIIQQQQSKF